MMRSAKKSLNRVAKGKEDKMEIHKEDAPEPVDDKRNAKEYISPHPQQKTRQARAVPEQKAPVPNFVKRSLPRRDKADFQYYCRTTLSLFKPWRRGTDLLKDKTWEAAFQDFNFT